MRRNLDDDVLPFSEQFPSQFRAGIFSPGIPCWWRLERGCDGAVIDQFHTSGCAGGYVQCDGDDVGHWGTTVGSLAWAIDQANQSAAASNTISIAQGLTINVDDAVGSGSSYNLATLLKSVTIQGNNATLVGNPTFVTTGGQAYTKNNPDPFTPTSGDILVIPSFSFLKIGTYGESNSGINVAVSNLTPTASIAPPRSIRELRSAGPAEILRNR